MRQRLEGNYAKSLCSQSIKFASFNTRRKAPRKAALVGAERWAGSMAYTWAQESFRTHPETGSDEISSHMN